MFCSVCKINLNSSLQADSHYAGKSHKYKAKSTASEGDMATDTSTSIPSNIQLHKCDICEKYFNSMVQLRDHTYGKAHQQKASKKLENTTTTLDGETNPGTMNPGTLNLETMTPGTLNQGTSNAETLNPGTMTPGTLNQGTLNPGTMTPGILDTGLTGSRPSDDLATTEPMVVTSESTVGKNLSQLFHCARCNITLNSKKQLDQHKKGLRHKIMIGKANPPAVGGEKWENVRFTKISNAILGINKDTATGSGGGMNIREYHCEKCNITVNSQIQLNQHLESNKHKMKEVEAPNNAQNKRKRPPPTGNGAGQMLPQGNTKRPYQRPKPLSHNFVNSNTYIPAGGGKPLYRLPPLPRQYQPLNTSLPSWGSYGSFGFSTNVAMF